MKKRVYTLYRVSTLGQVEKDDIPMQKEACRAFAKAQGWEIVKEFSEKGVSGFKKSAKERDQLQKIQQAAMAREFDVLLVFMFDRLGRRDDETPFVVEWFVKQGIEVWSTQEGQQRFETQSTAKWKPPARSCGSSNRSCSSGRRSYARPASVRKGQTLSASARRRFCAVSSYVLTAETV